MIRKDRGYVLRITDGQLATSLDDDIRDDLILMLVDKIGLEVFVKHWFDGETSYYVLEKESEKK